MHRRFWLIRFGVAAIVLAAVAAACASIWRGRIDSLNDGTRELRNNSTVLAGQIEQSIQAVDITLRSLRRHIESVDDWLGETPTNIDTLRVALLRELAHLPQAHHVAFANAGGQIVATTEAWPTPHAYVTDSEAFRRVAMSSNNHMDIWLPVPGTAIPLIFARRVNTFDGSFGGVVFVGVRPAYFKQFFAKVDTGPHAEFALFGSNRETLTGHSAFWRAVASEIEFDFAAEHAVSYRIADPSGARWIGIASLRSYPMAVAVSHPEDAILANWRTWAVYALIGTLLFLAFAALLLRIVVRQFRQISISERHLVEKTEALEREQARLVESEAKLKLKNERFDTALGNMSHGLAMFDRNGRLLVCNDRFVELMRYPPGFAVPGRFLRDLVKESAFHRGTDGETETLIGSISEMVAGRAPSTHEIRDNLGHVVLATNRPMIGGGWLAMFEDVTERRASEEKIKRLARFDSLTGLANRSQFLEQIEIAGGADPERRRPFCVLLFDLDRFKDINDSLGHAAGDLLLAEVSKRLNAAVREGDVLARIGGDEFAIIQREPRHALETDDIAATMRAGAVALANRIIHLLGQPYEIDGHRAYIGVSIGIAISPIDGTHADDLLRKADCALYKVKNAGRNGYAFFDVELAAAVEQRHRIEIDLRSALANGEFELYYQPVVDVGTRRFRSMEALIRWHHPEAGMIGPDTFIPIAEDVGLITAIGEWVIETACREAAKWPPDVKLAINTSPVQFQREGLLEVVLCTLAETGLSPDRLEIEITERVLLDDSTEHLAVLRQLKNAGVSIILDDFGTGYSSLQYLKMFPFDKIKIDRSFTKEVLERSECAAIAAAIIGLGRALDIVTVAEGIETEAQLIALRAAGLAQAQGFLFGRPAPIAEIHFEPPLLLPNAEYVAGVSV